MRFGFLITARCNASCTHCTVSSGPHQTTQLETGQVCHLMDQAADIWKRERARGEGLSFSISGGEPFLDFDRLLRLVRHGTSLGAHVNCVTNGSWASSEDKARARLQALADAGLRDLAVSTSRFHQQFVKQERVQRVLDLAPQVGIRVALKCAVTAGDRDRARPLEDWARSRETDHLEVFPVLPYLREGAALPEGEYIRRSGLPQGRCPGLTLTVREDGNAYSCCMPGGFAPLLRLGNVLKTRLRMIYDRFYLRGTQQVLRHRGPIHFARAVIAQGQGRRLRKEYQSVCDLCAHIAGDPVMARIAQRAAGKFAREQLLEMSR